MTESQPAASTAAPHQREIYEPLRLYSRMRRGTEPATAEPFAHEVLNNPLPADHLPAAQGSHFARLAWCALAAWFGKYHREKMADFLTTLAARQQPDGPFLLATASDNPEPHWYHELVILHALATFTAVTQAHPLQTAVDRAAFYHLQETQPDHATTEPWAVHAFVRHVDTLPVADALLHAVQAQHGGTVDEVSWMLLDDALYCLKETHRKQ